MTVTFGEITFDHVSYDREADVLYMNVSGKTPAHWEESREGHALRFAEDGTLCGMTVIGVSHHVNERGQIKINIPELVDVNDLELGQDLVLA